MWMCEQVPWREKQLSEKQRCAQLETSPFDAGTEMVQIFQQVVQEPDLDASEIKQGVFASGDFVCGSRCAFSIAWTSQ